MTTNKTRRYTLALILPFLLLATGCDSQSAMVDSDPPVISAGAFTINSSQVAVSPTSSEGTFRVSGVLDDHGACRDVLSSAEPLHRLASVSGQKTLEGAKGTITVEFYVGLTATDHNTVAAEGGFGIVEGSGAYAGLRGGGEIDLELDRNASAAALTEVLEGEARYLP